MSSVKRSVRTDGLVVVGVMAALMWVLEIIDSLDSHRLDAYGIHPRTADGLPEIVSAPFLHASFGHLVSNTIPFLVMGAVIALSGAVRVLIVTAIVGLVSGVGVWVLAPGDSVTVGASGIVFGYATYLLARGIFNRDALQLVIGAFVGAIWGAALIGSLIPHDGISWQAHAFGALGGVLAARLLARDRGAPTTPRTLAGPRVQV